MTPGGRIRPRRCVFYLGTRPLRSSPTRLHSPAAQAHFSQLRAEPRRYLLPRHGCCRRSLRLGLRPREQRRDGAAPQRRVVVPPPSDVVPVPEVIAAHTQAVAPGHRRGGDFRIETRVPDGLQPPAAQHRVGGENVKFLLGGKSRRADIAAAGHGALHFATLAPRRTRIWGETPIYLILSRCADDVDTGGSCRTPGITCTGRGRGPVLVYSCNYGAGAARSPKKAPHCPLKKGNKIFS